MSMRYPGGLIATSPVNARYPSGVWTQAQAAPYQAQNVWTRDQFWPYTTLLLQGDGAVNGAQNNTFLDSSSNNFTITRNGNTTQGSFTPYEQDGYWSNYFDGASSLLPASNAAFNFGTGDFTVEAWVYQPASGTQCIYDCRSSDASAAGFFFGTISTNFAVFTNNTIAISTPMQLNTWMHFAIVRSGSTWTLYKNGVSAGTYSSSANLSDANRQIGASTTVTSSSTNYLTGYISNLRVVKGTAVYTSAFTPSAAPLTAITNTSLLTCQSNRFKDNSTNAFAITVNGSPSVQAFQPFPGATTWSGPVLGGSAYFDGNGDYLQPPSSSSFAFGGDFTVEAWVYLMANPPTDVGAYLIDFRVGSTNNFAFAFVGFGGASRMYGFVGSGAISVTGNAVVTLNQWNHVAYVRSGSTITLYLNGVSCGTFNSSFSQGTTSATIASRFNATEYFTGYMSNVRVLNGTAQYTSNFTPPAAPFTNITNTSLLLNMTNAGIYDNSMMNNLETVGNAQVSTSVVKYGTGSMSFVRSPSSYLVANNSTRLLSLGTGDWTVEAWVYMNTLPAGNGYPNSYWIVGGGPSNSDTGFDIAIGSTNLQVGLTTFLSLNINTAHGMVANTWYHVAVVRSGATLYAFINGSQLATASVSGVTVDPCLTGLAISAAEPTGATSGNFNGYIDDLRITKGAARYIGNFTPPIARLPAQ